MTYQYIKFGIERCVATIALSRPEKRNALIPEMADEICDALGKCEGARAILLKGEGQSFCSGADISDVSEHRLSSDAAYDSLSQHYNPMLLAIARHELPVVAQVQGAVAGIGCSLALACDFCLAGEDAYFKLAFVNIGLAPDGGASWHLPRLIGSARAAWLMMLGCELSAARAAEWGLIYGHVPNSALAEEGRAIAGRLAHGPTKALGAMKRNLAASFDASLAEVMETEAREQRKIAQTDDAREGIEAFLQKRAPQFKGQ